MSQSTPQAATKEARGNSALKKAIPLLWLLGGALAGTLVASLPLGITREAAVTLGVFVFTVAVWISDIMPTGMAAVVWGALLIVILGDKMPMGTVFKGFTQDTIWLMVGALLIGQATTKTNLAKRIAYRLMLLAGSSYTSVLIWLWVAQIVLGLFTPSGTVRCAMFIPIMAGIVEAYGAKRESRFAANLLLHVYWASIAGSTLWYTGTNLNITAMGVLKQATGYAPSWVAWLIWEIIPTLTLSVGVFALIQWIMPPEKEYAGGSGGKEAIKANLEQLGPMSAAEKRALALFLVAIILWATEKWHGIGTAWVAAFVGAALFLPEIGVLAGKDLNNISWDTILLMGIALGIGSVMQKVKLDTWLSERLLNPIMGPMTASLGSFGLAFGIALFVGIVHFLMPSGSAETAALSPVLVNYALQAGLDPRVTAMSVCRGAMNLLIFPYQGVPLVVLWGTGYMNMKRCVLSFGVISIFLLIWQGLMGPYWTWIMNLVRF